MIDASTELSAGRVRSLFGAGAGAIGDVFSELTATRHHGAVIDDSPSRPRWSVLENRLWSGSAKIRFEDAQTIALASGSRAGDGSIAVSIGGSQTTVTGNLEMYEDALIFAPHDSWRKRGIDVMQVKTDLPVLFSGITPNQSGPRALAVRLAPSRTCVVFRLGMLLAGLDTLISARLAEPDSYSDG